MTAGNYYGRMRATDADREKVHQELQTAYADGRLTWDEFDNRSTALIHAKTYDQLASLTTDLRRPVPYQPGRNPVPLSSGRTNALAAVSLGFGVGQMFLPFIGAIIAIVTGHVARSQIKETGDYGAGLAIAGLVLGYLGIALPILFILFVLGSLR
jgi:Domain of unknown function (DUF1707)/Domain of unknown function (DUF4190)